MVTLTLDAKINNIENLHLDSLPIQDMSNVAMRYIHLVVHVFNNASRFMFSDV